MQPVQVVEIEVEQAHRLTEARVERRTKYVNQLQAQLKEAGEQPVILGDLVSG